MQGVSPSPLLSHGMTDSDKKLRCYLLEIPPELRLNIYDYVFAETPPCYVNLSVPHGSGYEVPTIASLHRQPFGLRHRPKHTLALLKSCRTVTREAAPILYKSTVFQVTLDIWEHMLFGGTSWPLASSSAFLKYVKSVTVSIMIYKGADITQAVQNMRTLFRLLPADPAFRLSSVVLVFHPSYKPGEVEPILTAVGQLGIRGSPTLMCKYGRDKVSSRVWSELVEKLGAKDD